MSSVFWQHALSLLMSDGGPARAIGPHFELVLFRIGREFIILSTRRRGFPPSWPVSLLARWRVGSPQSVTKADVSASEGDWVAEFSGAAAGRPREHAGRVGWLEVGWPSASKARGLLATEHGNRVVAHTHTPSLLHHKWKENHRREVSPPSSPHPMLPTPECHPSLPFGLCAPTVFLTF